jgi:hypothetical protein
MVEKARRREIGRRFVEGRSADLALAARATAATWKGKR